MFYLILYLILLVNSKENQSKSNQFNAQGEIRIEDTDGSLLQVGFFEGFWIFSHCPHNKFKTLFLMRICMTEMAKL